MDGSNSEGESQVAGKNDTQIKITNEPRIKMGRKPLFEVVTRPFRLVIGKRGQPQNVNQPTLVDNPIKSGQEVIEVVSPQEAEIPRQTNIATNFLQEITSQGLTIEGEFKKIGVAAMEGTNESGSPSLFEKVRNQEFAPNGYLIGIGASNVFSMLEAFPKGQAPKAIILFDVDPAVVEFGQRLIQTLKDNPNKLPFTVEDYKDSQIFNEAWGANPKLAIKRYAPLLHQLTTEGNIIIARADFTNPQLIQGIAQLPEFKDLNNIIYLSNIVDHLNRSNYSKVPDFSFLEQLGPTSSQRNYYIDTLQKGLDYNLRVGTRVPHFSREDFLDTDDLNSALKSFQTKPIDLIDRTEQTNPLYEDLSAWDLPKLIEVYSKLEVSPRQQARREFIQRRITENRDWIRNHYSDFKEKAKQPPEKLTHGDIEHRYVVPDSLEEEQKLLEELAQPYSYDDDYLPLLAQQIWDDAKTVDQVDVTKIPDYDKSILKDPATGQRYIFTDTRGATKGRVEIDFIRGKLPFEELVISKIYQQVKRRLLQRNPKIDTRGKSFGQLVTELSL